MTRADGQLQSYDEIVSVLDSLWLLVREKRRTHGLSLRAAAEQSGIDPSALHRAEQGDNMRLSTAIAIVQWLGEK